MDSRIVIPIILQLLGIVIILAEFVVPSMGLLTATAVGAFGYSIYLIFQAFGAKVTAAFICLDVALIPVLIWAGVKLLAKSPVALKSELSKSNGNVSQDLSLTELIGKEGVVTSILRPAGKARIEGKRYDVVSTGDYIDKDTTVYVTAVDGNRIVVKKR